MTKTEHSRVSCEAQSNRFFAGADLELGNRYRLWRRWHVQRMCVLWVMLNPSIADAREDDPTIRKCIGFATRWGYGGIEVVNLYSIIATDPAELRRLGWPNGPRADDAIRDVLTGGTVGLVVYAWGNHARPERVAQVDAIVQGLPDPFVPKCLGVTRSGQPRHPGRLAYSTALVPWNPSQR